MILKIINDVGCELASVEIKSTKEVANILNDWELEVGDTIKIVD